MLFGGQRAKWIDHSTDATIFQWLKDTLDAYLDFFPQPSQMLVTRWGNEIFSQGSFSYPTPAHSIELVKQLNTPIQQRLFFIGEHCSEQYAGTVHGAYLTDQTTAEHMILLNRQ